MNHCTVRHLQPRPVIEILITRVAGSAPIQVGDHMLYGDDGHWRGTVGGGKFEWELMRAVDRVPRPARVEQSLGPASDQCCGGRVEAHIVAIPAALSAHINDRHTRLYRRRQDELQLLGAWNRSGEWFGLQPPPADLCASSDSGDYDGGGYFVRARRPRTPLWLYGAGHVARAIARMAAELGFSLHVVDARSQWADAGAFPNPTRLYDDNGLALAVPTPESVALIMTHSHSLDYRLLKHLCGHRVAYLGVIGSRSKAARFRQALAREGYNTDALHMPIGLPGLGKRPAEIAVSVLAELLQQRRAR